MAFEESFMNMLLECADREKIIGQLFQYVDKGKLMESIFAYLRNNYQWNLKLISQAKPNGLLLFIGTASLEDAEHMKNDLRILLDSYSAYLKKLEEEVK